MKVTGADAVPVDVVDSETDREAINVSVVVAGTLNVSVSLWEIDSLSGKDLELVKDMVRDSVGSKDSVGLRGIVDVREADPVSEDERLKLPVKVNEPEGLRVKGSVIVLDEDWDAVTVGELLIVRDVDRLTLELTVTGRESVVVSVAEPLCVVEAVPDIVSESDLDGVRDVLSDAVVDADPERDIEPVPVSV